LNNLLYLSLQRCDGIQFDTAYVPTLKNLSYGIDGFHVLPEDSEVYVYVSIAISPSAARVTRQARYEERDIVAISDLLKYHPRFSANAFDRIWIAYCGEPNAGKKLIVL